MRHGDCRHRRHRGFTYVWVLAAVAVLSVGLAAVGPAWADRVRREKERDLLRVGRLYAQAIASYRAVSPGSLKRYPPSLESLLVDTRFAGTQRHLRKLYADPLDPRRPWGLVKAADGSILGVYSQGAEVPLSQVPIDLGVVVLPVANSYAEWKFIPKADP